MTARMPAAVVDGVFVISSSAESTVADAAVNVSWSEPFQFLEAGPGGLVSLQKGEDGVDLHGCAPLAWPSRWP
jgi:hypothetical protein